MGCDKAKTLLTHNGEAVSSSFRTTLSSSAAKGRGRGPLTKGAPGCTEATHGCSATCETTLGSPAGPWEPTKLLKGFKGIEHLVTHPGETPHNKPRPRGMSGGEDVIPGELGCSSPCPRGLENDDPHTRKLCKPTLSPLGHLGKGQGLKEIGYLTALP